MAKLRIEFTERFMPMDGDELETFRNLHPNEKLPYKYRRTYIKLSDIFAPKEIPGYKSHCQIEMYDGYIMVVKGDYDTICNAIDDREKLLEEENYRKDETE